MLIIMSKHFSISTPQLDGAKFFIFPLLIRMVLFTATVAISVISAMQRTERENQRVTNELKSEKLDMELRLLKSQMTPHFLFNALNNIYSLVYTKDENAPQSVLKLSDMMRYVMVDCQGDEISASVSFTLVHNSVMGRVTVLYLDVSTMNPIATEVLTLRPGTPQNTHP